MKVVNFIVLVFCIFLASCATPPDLLLLSEPVKIDMNQLDKYWLQKNEVFRLKPRPYTYPKGVKEGYVVIRFIIDSNGNTFNPEIVESVPKGAFDWMAVQALAKIKYVRAGSNVNSVPVVVAKIFEFDS